MSPEWKCPLRTGVLEERFHCISNVSYYFETGCARQRLTDSLSRQEPIWRPHLGHVPKAREQIMFLEFLVRLNPSHVMLSCYIIGNRGIRTRGALWKCAC